MTFSSALHAFFTDMKFQIVLVVIFLDFVLGVLAALKQGNFRLSYIADFGRNDIEFKLLPWLIIYVASKFAGHQQLVIPGVDVGVAAGAAYAAFMAGWAGSILTSLAELGVPTGTNTVKTALAAKYGPLPGWLAAPENAAPPKD